MKYIHTYIGIVYFPFFEASFTIIMLVHKKNEGQAMDNEWMICTENFYVITSHYNE